MLFRFAMVLVCVAAVASMLPALAQTGTGRPGASTGPRGGATPPRPEDERPQQPGLLELVTVRMSQLEEDLQLQSKQLPAWNHFRDRVQRLLDDRRRQIRGSTAEMTAPQRLDALADNVRNRLAAVEDVVDAGKTLYTQLTPEQRIVADRRLALPLATLAGTDPRGDERGAPGSRPQGGPAGAGTSQRP